MRIWKKAVSLMVAALVIMGAFSACSPGEDSSQAASSSSSQLELENNGASTRLVVAEISYSPERTAALEEIAQKYMADFPQTQIEIVTVETGEEAQTLLESGQADLVELTQQEQPSCVEQGLLVELSSYLDVWEERFSLTAAAQQVVASMGDGRAYLLPATLNQDVAYYRSDWFEEYNAGREEGLVYCRIWEDLPTAQERLADKGAAGLVFGGQEHLVDLFDSILWSAADVGRLEDPAAGYFSAVDGHTTLFTLEQADAAMEQFTTLLESTVPEECLTWTEDQALEAFTSGQAIVLLAGQDRMDDIAAVMEEGSWDVAAYPRGITGHGITSLEYTGFGVAASAGDVGNAVHFLTYLSNGDNNTHLAKACGTVPIHTTAADLDPTLEDTGLAVNLTMVRRADWYDYAQEPLMYHAMEGWREQANTALRQYLSGQLTQQELLSGFDAYWQAALKEEGALWKSQEEQ